MRIKALLCAVAGHGWAPAADSHEAVAVLQCKRCGRRRAHSSEQFVIEGVGRGRRVQRSRR
jgi:hypothetical protein